MCRRARATVWVAWGALRAGCQPPRSSSSKPATTSAVYASGSYFRSCLKSRRLVATQYLSQRATTQRDDCGMMIVQSKGVLGDAPMSQCRYCGSTSFGSYCSNAPNHIHQHNTDSTQCEYCGSSSYGSYCPNSPNHIHYHGAGTVCRWCGNPSYGSYCSDSPTHAHEH
jgi:hypothetical protein